MSKRGMVNFLMVGIILFMMAPGQLHAVVISEFMASNDQTIFDEDGQSSDWIEIFNDQAVSVNLSGWSLTDDPDQIRKWRFPDVELAPGQFLLIFASGKNRTDPNSELHTNFKLSSSGEYLGLATAQGKVVSSFAPKYPEQLPDISYGMGMETGEKALFSEGVTANFFVPADDTIQDTWMLPDFDDSAWQSGPTGIGFDQKTTPTYADLIQTDVGDIMRRENSTIYIRIPFTLAEEDLHKLLKIRMKFEDGFIAYVNGVEVASENVLTTSPVSYNSRAARGRITNDALTFAEYRFAGLSDVLKAGENVLAIQGLNSSRTGSDFFVLPLMDTVEIQSLNMADNVFFKNPSPLWPNTGGVSGIAAKPVFSVPGGARTDPFDLVLTGAGDDEIRYTLDGSEPTEESDLYTNPLTINSTVIVRARGFQTEHLASPVVSTSYVFLNNNLVNFDSNLPIVIINTFGKNITQSWVKMHMHIIDRSADGRAHMTGKPDFTGAGQIKVRGSSTAGRPKKSFTLEIQDGNGDDMDAEILGLPPESDFILYGAYNFDLSLMRNAFIYEISNEVGRYAVRTRFCEVWINMSNGTVSTAHYMGVYSFMEKIKRDKNRVDIQKILPEDNNEPEITGGYILKDDRCDPGDSGFTAGGQSLCWVEPKEREVTPQQKAWVSNWINEMANAIHTRNPEVYKDYIDIDSWIDHHILNVFPKNVDAFRLSGFMFKDREGKMEMGPIWDYDRSMGSTDGRDRDPESWPNTGGDGGTAYFQYGWYGFLFSNVPPTGTDEWAVRYRARWRELREGPLSTENISNVIDGMAEEIGEAATRNWQKWHQGSSNYQANVNQLKSWLTRRVTWIDAQFTEPPAFNHPGGLVSEGFQVSLSTPTGEIYYTLDGSDPKSTNSDPSPTAILYSDPITITENVMINARTRVSTNTWSELVSSPFYTYLLPLVVTEIMYNPPPDPNGTFSTSYFEYIEVKNTSDEEIDLTGVSFVDRIRFNFSEGDVTTLGPGEFAVVVRRRNAFISRYGDSVKIAGQFSGALSNGSMFVSLKGSKGEDLMNFEYKDSWYPETDGDGYSLVIRDPMAPRESWNDPANWKASESIYGSPGREDGLSGFQMPGDINQDGRFNLPDAIKMTRYVFGLYSNLPCSSAEGNLALLDLNGDLTVNLADIVFGLNYMYQAGIPPALGIQCVEIKGCPDACSY